MFTFDQLLAWRKKHENIFNLSNHVHFIQTGKKQVVQQNNTVTNHLNFLELSWSLNTSTKTGKCFAKIMQFAFSSIWTTHNSINTPVQQLDLTESLAI